MLGSHHRYSRRMGLEEWGNELRLLTGSDKCMKTTTRVGAALASTTAMVGGIPNSIGKLWRLHLAEKWVAKRLKYLSGFI